MLRPDYSAKYAHQGSFYVETSITDRAFNGSGCHTNALSIWSPTQNSLAMLDGFPVDSAIGKKRVEIDAEDDGIRGHFCVDGTMTVPFSGAVVLRSFFRDAWAVSAYLPMYVMELKNVCWMDQTKNVTDDDIQTKELLTSKLFDVVCNLGDGLELGGWKRSGVGDLALFLEWFHDFPQPKPLLKNVRVNWRAGVSIPTGKTADPDKIMALPFGTDGAAALPFGVGLDLSFVFHIRAGFDVQLMQTFGNTRCRRVKTAADQTDLLFLKKVDAYKDFGLTQQFSLYGQIYKLVPNTSLMLAYQFLKHGRDEISVCGESISNAIANTATNLRDWTVHQIILRADYDFGYDPAQHAVNPRLCAYVRFPFNGKRAIADGMFGMTFALDF